MTALSEHLSLAADFPATSRVEWQKLVAATLQKSGVAVERLSEKPESVLASRTADGITIEPLYTPDGFAAAHGIPDALAGRGLPGRAPFVRGSRAVDVVEIGWDVRQQHLNPDVAATKRSVLDDLEHGVTSLWLVLGTQGIAVADLAAALTDVYLDLAPIVLDAGDQTREAANALLAVVRERETESTLDSNGLRLYLGADPIGWAARTGTEPDATLLADLATSLQDWPLSRIATVDSTVYHEAGASASDELAIAASVGVEYLRQLTAAGLDIGTALQRLDFRLAVTADQFGSIAKLRAARQIWSRIAELSGAAETDRAQRQHAVTSASMLTRRDPWVNMLRTTIACFAAAVAGAEAITVQPFDAAIGIPDDFSRRIARNTQTILHDESSLARVLDPAGGSWYVESLTDELAAVAWQKFTELEAAGGASAALASGRIAELIEASRTIVLDRVRHRKDPITGVSEFAFPDEAPVLRTPAPAPAGGGLPRIRFAEVFETLRDRSDAQLAATGSRPAVFLAALGPVAAHSARVGFARNLFEVGGLDTPEGMGSTDELVAAFLSSGSKAICLCSSDKVYADEAEQVAAALKAAGAVRIWIAGKPALATGSVDAAIFVGCDAVTVLEDVLQTLEVAQ